MFKILYCTLNKREKEIIIIQQLKANNKLITDKQRLLKQRTGLIIPLEQWTIKNISIITKLSTFYFQSQFPKIELIIYF